MTISSGTVLKVVASLLLPDDVIAQNVFNAVVTDLSTSDAEEDVVDDCVDWIEALYSDVADQIADVVTASDVKVYEYDDIDDDWDEVGTGDNTVSFTAIGEMVSHGVALIAHMRTIDPDTQGTKYIPGCAESGVNASNLGGAPLAAMADFVATWFTPFVGAETGGTFSPVVWSPTDTTPRAAILSGYVNGQVGYQRRRKPGVGS